MNGPSHGRNQPAAGEGFEAICVAVLEDNDDLRLTIADLLRAQGHTTLTAASAMELEAQVRSTPIDVLLADLNLPDEDGLSVTARFKRAFPELKVIMMTTRSRLMDRVRGYEMGADVYLPKPFDLDELLAVVGAVARPILSARKVTYQARLDVVSAQLTGPSGTVNLSSQEVATLSALSLAVQQELEYWELLELMGGAEMAIEKSTLFVHMTRLRDKLGKVGLPSESLKSQRLRGYKLAVAIEIC